MTMYQLAHFSVGVVKLKEKYRPVGNIVQILPEVEGTEAYLETLSHLRRRSL